MPVSQGLGIHVAQRHDIFAGATIGIAAALSPGAYDADVEFFVGREAALSKLRELLTNKQNAAANRIRPAMTLGWIDRLEKHTPIVLSALHINDTSLLHLPAECFVEYQLRAQHMVPGRFVATAAYGDGGPWYIPVKEAYPQGGYEVSVANCADAVDDILTAGKKTNLRA